MIYLLDDEPKVQEETKTEAPAPEAEVKTDAAPAAETPATPATETKPEEAKVEEAKPAAKPKSAKKKAKAKPKAKKAEVPAEVASTEEAPKSEVSESKESKSSSKKEESKSNERDLEEVKQNEAIVSLNYKINSIIEYIYKQAAKHKESFDDLKTYPAFTEILKANEDPEARRKLLDTLLMEKQGDNKTHSLIDLKKQMMSLLVENEKIETLLNANNQMIAEISSKIKAEKGEITKEVNVPNTDNTTAHTPSDNKAAIDPIDENFKG